MPGAASVSITAAGIRVAGAAAGWQAERAATRAGLAARLVVAIDGHGAAGKSTLAAAVAAATGAALVHTDDFFRADPPGGPAPGGQALGGQALGGPAAGGPEPGGPAAGGQALGGYYDWRRLRTQALEPLRAGRAAAFRRFDWERGSGLDGRVTVAPAPLILLEGVFSAAPELADLVDRSVFVDTPRAERLRRLRRRVLPDEWDDDWLNAEQAYFGAVRPPSSFDLVVRGG